MHNLLCAPDIQNAVRLSLTQDAEVAMFGGLTNGDSLGRRGYPRQRQCTNWNRSAGPGPRRLCLAHSRPLMTNVAWDALGCSGMLWEVRGHNRRSFMAANIRLRCALLSRPSEISRKTRSRSATPRSQALGHSDFSAWLKLCHSQRTLRAGDGTQRKLTDYNRTDDGGHPDPDLSAPR